LPKRRPTLNTAQVTLAGQSSGADAVGLQILANGGDNEQLFRAAVMESGGLTNDSPFPPADYAPWQTVYDKLVNATNCTGTSDTFECLRALPISTLYPAIHSLAIALAPIPGLYGQVYSPVIDGTFITDYPSKLVAAGKFAKLPILTGVVTDESSFIIPVNLNLSSDTDLVGLFKSESSVSLMSPFRSGRDGMLIPLPIQPHFLLCRPPS
jgi:carboxylesterase type B